MSLAVVLFLLSAVGMVCSTPVQRDASEGGECSPYLRLADGQFMTVDISEFYYMNHPKCLDPIVLALMSKRGGQMRIGIEKREGTQICRGLVELLSVIETHKMAEGMCQDYGLQSERRRVFCDSYPEIQKQLTEGKMVEQLANMKYSDLVMATKSLLSLDCKTTCGGVAGSALCSTFLDVMNYFMHKKIGGVPNPSDIPDKPSVVAPSQASTTKISDSGTHVDDSSSTKSLTSASSTNSQPSDSEHQSYSNAVSDATSHEDLSRQNVSPSVETVEQTIDKNTGDGDVQLPDVDSGLRGGEGDGGSKGLLEDGGDGELLEDGGDGELLEDGGGGGLLEDGGDGGLLDAFDNEKDEDESYYGVGGNNVTDDQLDIDFANFIDAVNEKEDIDVEDAKEDADIEDAKEDVNSIPVLGSVNDSGDGDGEDEDDAVSSHGSWFFFTLFLFVATVAITGYLCMHNRKKIRENMLSYMSNGKQRRSRIRDYKPLLGKS